MVKDFRKSQRPERVGEQIRQVLSELVMDGSIKVPELAAASLVTFTEVRVTKDLRNARVFTSVFPSEEQVVVPVIEGLCQASPKIRSLVAKEVRLRHAPDLLFVVDRSIEQGARMEALIKQVRSTDEPEPSEEEEG